MLDFSLYSQTMHASTPPVHYTTQPAGFFSPLLLYALHVLPSVFRLMQVAMCISSNRLLKNLVVSQLENCILPSEAWI